MINEDGEPIAMNPRKRRRRNVELLKETALESPNTGLVSDDIVHDTNSSDSDNESKEGDAECSDLENYSDDDNDLMDELIESQSDKDKETVHGKDSLNNLVDKIITDNYVNEVPDPYLEPVSSLFAEHVTKWCRNPPKREELKEMFKDCLCPRNIEGLQSVRINEALYKYLPKSAKINDQKLKGINAFICRSMGPVIHIFEQLCKMEIKSSSDKTFTGNSDAKSLRKFLGNSIKLSCAANAIILQRRKSNLKYYMDPKFHYLTRDSNPITTLLFGDNIEQSIADSTRVLEVAKKVSKSHTRDFRPNFRQNFRQRFYPHRRYPGTGHYSRNTWSRRNNFRSQRRGNRFPSSTYVQRGTSSYSRSPRGTPYRARGFNRFHRRN